MNKQTYEEIFNLCVMLLNNLADLLGMTYKEINVWLFVVIHPLITLILLLLLIHFWKKYHQLLRSVPIGQNN